MPIFKAKMTLSRGFFNVKKEMIMRTPHQIFQNDPELEKHPAVQELISQFEDTRDALVDAEQHIEQKFTRLKHMEELVGQIRAGIRDELKKDEEAERFKETPRIDFKEAVMNLQHYISDYLRDYNIWM